MAHETIEALAHGVWKRGILHHRVELCAGCVDIARQRVRPGKLGARQSIVWLDGKNALKRDDCLCRLAAVCRSETVNIVEIRIARPLCHSRGKRQQGFPALASLNVDRTSTRLNSSNKRASSMHYSA